MKTKRLLPAALVMALLCALLAVSAMAAEVGGADSLAAALERGGDVALTTDVTAEPNRLKVPAGVSVRLDLAGHTLQCVDYVNYDVLLTVEGELTLCDSVGGGALRGAYDCVDVLGGSFTLESGNITDCGGSGVYLNGDEAARVTILGGAISDCRGYLGWYEDEEEEGWYGGACVFTEGGVLDVRGGVFSDSPNGICVIDGTGVISGGTIRDIYVTYTGDGAPQCGNAIEVYDGDVAVSGCTVVNAPFAFWIEDNGEEGGSAVTVSGGEFSGGECGVVLNGEHSTVTLSGGVFHGYRGELSEEEESIEFGSGLLVKSGSALVTGGEIYDCNIGIDLDDGAFVTVEDVLIRDIAVAASSERGILGGNGIDVTGGVLDFRGGTVRGAGFTGIVAANSGCATVTGGAFAENSYSDLCVGLGATLRISGAPALGSALNLWSFSGGTFAVEGALTNETPYTVWCQECEQGQDRIPILRGLAEGDAARFVSYNDLWYTLVPEGDACLEFEFVRWYDDVEPDDWYADAACVNAWSGLIETPDGHFHGDGGLTFGEYFTVFWRIAGSPETEPLEPWPFTDLEPDAPCADAIRWMVARGAKNDDGIAGVDREMQRCDMLDLLVFLPGLMERFERCTPSGELPYSDIADLDMEYWHDYLLWLQQLGMIEGMGDGTLGMEKPATRAQFATLLMRYLNLGLLWAE